MWGNLYSTVCVLHSVAFWLRQSATNQAVYVAGIKKLHNGKKCLAKSKLHSINSQRKLTKSKFYIEDMRFSK